jgi:hypothetical protein
MTITITVLLIIALLCLILAAFNVSLSPRVHLGWLGLAIVTLVTLVERGLIG